MAGVILYALIFQREMDFFKMTRFTHLLLLGSAACGLMVSHSAYADIDEGNHFRPARSWDVNANKPVSDYGGECTIETEFNNGFILKFEGSSNWVQQLDLDIRQDAFSAGEAYDVRLNIPGRASDTISAKADKGSVISVPLKGKKELYKAMRDNAVFDMSIEGNEFRFFLTGFNAAANKFERCMAGGAPGVVAAKNLRAETASNKATAAAGLGGIESNSLSVSSEDLSDAEKDFLLNESIAFEQQEVAVSNVPVQAAPAPVVTPEEIAAQTARVTEEIIEPVEAPAIVKVPQKEEIVSFPVEVEETINTPVLPDLAEPVDAVETVEVAAPTPKVEMEKPVEVKPAAVAEVITEPAPIVVAAPKVVEAEPVADVIEEPEQSEEDVVAALNAQAAQAARKRVQMAIAAKAQAEAAKKATMAAEASMPKVPDAQDVLSVSENVGDDAEEIVVIMDEPVDSSEETMVKAVREEKVEAIIVETPAVALPNSEPNSDAITPEPIEETVPVMPKSDVAASEMLLEQPERTIDMPRIKTNRQVSRGNADFAAPKIENADSQALARIVALEQALAKAEAENAALNDELQVTLKEGQQEVMSVENRNWNLERATMRFNEAERQMKKLGQQLQKERAQWVMEKKELETMLFDPEVTSQEQLARLSKLEQELAAAQAELDKARAGM